MFVGSLVTRKTLSSTENSEPKAVFSKRFFETLSKHNVEKCKEILRNLKHQKTNRIPNSEYTSKDSKFQNTFSAEKLHLASIYLCKPEKNFGLARDSNLLTHAFQTPSPGEETRGDF